MIVDAIPGYLWTVPSDAKVIPPFNHAVYHELGQLITKLANKYKLAIIAGYTPDRTDTLQGHGLAFDLAGRTPDMKRLARWAIERPQAFQEIFLIDEGEGLHLHLGLYPDAAQILNQQSKRYESARNPEK